MPIKKKELTVEFFTVKQTTGNASDSVPFYNQFVKDFELDDIVLVDAISVNAIHKTTKGCLIVTDVFKYFVFKGTEMYDHISQALTVWTDKGEVVSPMIIKPNNKRYCDIGLNHAMDKGIWKRSNNSFYFTTQTLVDTMLNPERSKKNPLLDS